MNKLTHRLCTMNFEHLHAILIALLVFALSGAPANTATTESQLQPFRAEYTVENDYITGGVATLSLTPKGTNSYDFVLQTKPTGIFKWTGKGNIREQALLQSLSSPFVSTHYTYTDKGRSERNYQLAFDREGGKFTYKRGNSLSTHDLASGAIDRLSVTLELLYKIKEDKNFKSMQSHVLDAKEVETVTYHNHGIEPVSTVLGEFKAYRILKDRENSNRETIIWLAEIGDANTVLPLKIEQYKGSKLTLRLIISRFSPVD